jgi:hypothetical protein
MFRRGSSSRQLLLLAGASLFIVELNITVSAKRAFLDEFSFFSQNVFDSDAFV